MNTGERYKIFKRLESNHLFHVTEFCMCILVTKNLSEANVQMPIS